VVSFMLQPLYPRGKALGTLFIVRTRWRREKYPCSCWESSPGHPASSLVTVLTITAMKIVHIFQLEAIDRRITYVVSCVSSLRLSPRYLLAHLVIHAYIDARFTVCTCDLTVTHFCVLNENTTENRCSTLSFFLHKLLSSRHFTDLAPCSIQ
jgi:hypothetical protein